MGVIGGRYWVGGKGGLGKQSSSVVIVLLEKRREKS